MLPIKIVPLYVAGRVAPATAQLTYRGGPLLEAVKVATVYWGAGWAADSTRTQLDAFFDFVLTSSYMDELSEYSAGGHTIGHGRRVASQVVTPNPGTSIADPDVQSMLTAEISARTLPQPDASTLYFVYLPDGVTVSLDGQSSCQNFCGYHDRGPNFYYATVPYPSCSGCRSTLEVFEALTVTSSHELAEAVTDPVVGQGWYDDTNGEIGDICAWQTKPLGMYTVQLEWSNKSQGCA